MDTVVAIFTGLPIDRRSPPEVIRREVEAAIAGHAERWAEGVVVAIAGLDPDVIPPAFIGLDGCWHQCPRDDGLRAAPARWDPATPTPDSPWVREWRRELALHPGGAIIMVLCERRTRRGRDGSDT